MAEHMAGDQRGKPLADLLRQSIYSHLAGYEDVNDAERLSPDPTFRLIGSEKIWERGAALTSRLHWFETEVLSQDENLDGLARINREVIEKAEVVDVRQRVVLDMDSTEIPVSGQQEHSAYSGHFESTCHHPLLLFNGEETVSGQSCGLEMCTVRRIGKNCYCRRSSGNRKGARKWHFGRTPPLPNRRSTKRWKNGGEIRNSLPANDSLLRDIEELLTRPVGRPRYKPVVWYKGLLYQSANWKTLRRRVVAKVKFCVGELFPRVGFIVTNLETPSRAVGRFYNERGTAEQWIKEGEQAVKMTHFSCHHFRSIQVRLALSLLPCNLGNLWRRLALPKRVENWSLTSLQQRLVRPEDCR